MPHIARLEMVIFPQHTGPRQRRAVGTDGFPFGLGLGSEAVWPQSHRRCSAGGMVRFFLGLQIGLTGLEGGARLRAMRSATAPGCKFQPDPGGSRSHEIARKQAPTFGGQRLDQRERDVA